MVTGSYVPGQSTVFTGVVLLMVTMVTRVSP